MKLWILSLVAFWVGGLSGVFFRWEMLNEFSSGLLAHHIRHAHSHIMLMAWVTPALMVLMVQYWKSHHPQSRNRGANISIFMAWLLAMLTFFPFLYYGYGRMPIGSASLPVAAIISGLAMMAWYAFAVIFWRSTRRITPTQTLVCWRWACAFLVVSSIGAWAVAFLMIKNIDNQFLSTLMIHIFVDLFSDGWLLFGALGLAYIYAPLRLPKTQKSFRIANFCMAIGLLGIFFLSVPSYLSPPTLRIPGHIAALFLGTGLVVHLVILAKNFQRTEHLKWWLIPYALLAIKAAALLSMVIPPFANWAEYNGFRILYLHIGFLGVISLVIVNSARDLLKNSGFTPALTTTFQITVLAMLAALLPLTGIWPTHWHLISPLYATIVTGLAVTTIPAIAVVQTCVTDKSR